MSCELACGKNRIRFDPGECMCRSGGKADIECLERKSALKLHGRVCCVSEHKDEKAMFSSFQSAEETCVSRASAVFCTCSVRAREFFGIISHLHVRITATIRIAYSYHKKKLTRKNPRSNTGTENEIPLQEYDSRFQECCDHVSKEEEGKECASKGCYERASYVVLECEAREPLFHPSLAHITHSCHLYNEDHSSNS